MSFGSFGRAREVRIPTGAEALPGRAEAISVAERHAVLGTPMKPPFVAEGTGQAADRTTRTAVFGMGCFWGAEKKFWQAPGVVSTQVWATPAAARRTPRTARSAPG